MLHHQGFKGTGKGSLGDPVESDDESSVSEPTTRLLAIGRWLNSRRFVDHQTSRLAWPGAQYILPLLLCTIHSYVDSGDSDSRKGRKFFGNPERRQAHVEDLGPSWQDHHALRHNN